MFSSDHKVVHHTKKMVAHVKKHQHTYLFFGGLAGGVFLFAKLVMLFGTSYMLYNASHDASFADDYVLTGTVIETPIETATGSTETTTGSTETTTGSTVTTTGSTETTTGSTETTTGSTETATGSIETSIVENENTEEYGFQPTSVCDYSGFFSNVTGGLYSGIMNMSWTINSACANQTVDIQLYDHNEEWITLDSIPGYVTEYSFDTTLLGSGFYLQTGLNASGNIEVINTGVYSGIAMKSWTGYYIRRLVQPDTILHQTQEFTIDNKKPILSNFSLVSSGVSSGVIGVGKSITIAFDSSELLTGVLVSVASGQATIASGTTGTHYVYMYNLPSSLISGPISYAISYKDLVGNTGSTTGISQLIYDNLYPQITGFALSGYNFSFVTSELTTANAFVLIRNTTNGWAFAMTGTATGHSFSLPTLSLNTDYDMGIVIKDLAGNESKAALALKRNSSGTIQYSLVATLYGQVLTNYSSGSNFLTQTGTIIKTGDIQETVVEQFKEEIDKFTECKNNIEYTKIKIQIKGSEIELNIPSFQRSEIKKLVNGFVLYILKSLEKAPLSEIELQDLAQKFDSFAVILKLIKDDDNSCKQNLSNYHLEQFKQSLDTYGIEI